MIGTRFWFTVGVNPRRKEVLILHTFQDSTQRCGSLTDVGFGS
jgi:hypothetical protein